MVAAAVDALLDDATHDVEDGRRTHGGVDVARNIGVLRIFAFGGQRSRTVGLEVNRLMVRETGVEVGVLAADALVGVAVVDRLAAAVDAELDLAAVHVENLQTIDQLLAEDVAIDVVARRGTVEAAIVVHGIEVGTLHARTTGSTGEDVAVEVATVDVELDEAHFGATAGIGALHVVGHHVAVADKTHVAATIYTI